jgi:hypothetical protein
MMSHKFAFPHVVALLTVGRHGPSNPLKVEGGCDPVDPRVKKEVSVFFYNGEIVAGWKNGSAVRWDETYKMASAHWLPGHAPTLGELFGLK